MTRVLELLVSLVIVFVLAVLVGVILPSHGHIERTVEVDLPKPRDQIVTRQMPKFLELRYLLHQAIGQSEHA